MKDRIVTPLARVAAALPCNGKHPPKLGIDSVLTVPKKAVEGGPIRATIPTQRRVSPGTGCGMAARGTRGKARAVGAAGPPPGCASAGRGGTGAAACRTPGERVYPDPTVETPDPTAGSRNPESSSR